VPPADRPRAANSATREQHPHDSPSAKVLAARTFTLDAKLTALSYKKKRLMLVLARKPRVA
jgi:hypothetical protein